MLIKISKDVLHKVIFHYFIARIPFHILQNTLNSKLVKHELMPPVQKRNPRPGPVGHIQYTTLNNDNLWAQPTSRGPDVSGVLNCPYLDIHLSIHPVYPFTGIYSWHKGTMSHDENWPLNCPFLYSMYIYSFIIHSWKCNNRMLHLLQKFWEQTTTHQAECSIVENYYGRGLLI